MKAADAPKRYPAPVQDRLLHLARHFHDGQGRWVLTFSGRLDTERIARAFELSLDAEPVLGCRFVEHPWRPYWERLPDVKRAFPLGVVETDNEDAINAWLATPFDSSTGVQVRACLFRGAKEKLAFIVSHEVADATGLLDYLTLVGSIYRELGKNPAYVPPPQAARLAQGSVLRNVGPRRLLRACLRFSYPPPGVDFPTRTPGGASFASRCIDAEGLSRIREYCRNLGATVHELLLAAFYRAQFQEFGAPSTAFLTIPIPIDLRRYLPSGTKWGVCNLSAMFFGGVRNQTFDTMVTDVHRLMASARTDEPWLGQALLLELAFLLPYGLIKRVMKRVVQRKIATGKVHPYITNYGIIDIRRFDFGDAMLSDFETWSPVFNHPLPFFSVYTVGDTLRITVATRDEPNGGRADRLIDAYVRELPGQGLPAGRVPG